MLLCGWGTTLRTKSEKLLSESSPLPINSSEPPIPIEIFVEVSLALRSALVPAERDARGVPSPKGFATTPMVNASTKIPVFNAPLRSPMLLLFAILFVLLTSHPKLPAITLLHQRKYP